ncbi:MAG: hypothetical protein LBI65_02125 [Candidatus Symbiothrix sp.]|jgi:hypothetical protein|nr:hypothetical protein [Candidatus Symbiothrix sp.]
MYKDFKDLTPDVVREILAGKNTAAISPDVLQYVCELDSSAKIFKGNVSRAANLLREKYPHLSIRTARERIYDSIRFLNAGEKELPAKNWYSYYADRYEELASLLALSPQTVRHAKACFDSALDCRLKVADTGLPDEMLQIKLQLISPDTKIDRLAITESNLKDAFEEGLKMIDTFDIPETDRKRIIGEFGKELGMNEDIETIEDAE